MSELSRFLFIFFLFVGVFFVGGCAAVKPTAVSTMPSAPVDTETAVSPTPTQPPATEAAVPSPTDTPASTATAVPTHTTIPHPTETATNTPIPLPPPPGEIAFLWSPEPEDDTAALPQNLYFAKPGDTAGEWEMETALTDLHAAGLYLSPDGTNFAVRLFEDTNGDGIVSAGGENSNVYLYPLVDKTLTRLTEAETKGTVQVNWLPDSQQFTYSLNKDIFLFDLESSTSKRLLSFPGLIYLHQWSPDGRWLAIVSRLSDEPVPGGESHRLDLYDAETDELISVVSKLGGSRISWSPDSQWFAFSHDSSNQGLYVTSINDLVPIQLSSGTSFASWSPDGQSLAFTTQLGTGNLFLWNSNTQSTQNLLQENGGITAPIWSPDGSKLAVGLIEDDRARLVTVEVSTSVANTIFTSLDPGGYGPSWQSLKPLNWSPDGEWLLFLVFETDKRNMLAANASHNTTFSVLDFTGTDVPEDVYWLP